MHAAPELCQGQGPWPHAVLLPLHQDMAGAVHTYCCSEVFTGICFGSYRQTSLLSWSSLSYSLLMV